MEVQGKIIDKLQPKGGQTARGAWKKHEIIVETNETYPKKICMASWNDKVDLTNFNPGDEVTASINIESREYNGNWYTDIRIWKMEKAGNANPGNDLPGATPPAPGTPPWEQPAEDSDQDLPF